MAKARATANKDQGKLFEEKPESSQEKGPQLFWGGALFNENYLRVDVPQKYKQWENDEYGPFKTFTEKFLDLCHRLDEEKFDSWSETETINNWIVKIMKLLGWHNTCESDDQNPYLEQVSFTEEDDSGKKRTYRPDLLYVDYIGEKKAIASPKNVAGDTNQAHKLVRMVVEAKYWNRLEEYGNEKGPDKKRNDHDNDDVRYREPEEQLLKYIHILDKDFGILTDGKVWRLLHKELSECSGQYRSYQFDLGQLRELAFKIHEGKSRQLFVDAAKYFYFFFAKESFYPEKGIPLISDVLEFNKKYASQIEEDLKKRFISAMSIACNGFNRTAHAKSPEDLATIRDAAESHIFNILFIRSCEVRDILSLKNMAYLRISLSEIVNHFSDPALPYSYNPKVSDELNVKYMEKNFNSGKDSQFGKLPANGTDIYDRLINLYKVIYDGSHDFKISGFKETVFSKDEWKFAKANKLNNSEMLKLLFNLCYIEGTAKGTFQQIPYNYFTPRQLGSIYESFLEYGLMKADEDMAFVDKQWKPANIESNKVKEMDVPTVQRGELYFTPNNKDRKDTGSFYTPDYVVKYIIRETLEPIIKDRTASDLLTLTICDPAMGSGHFLNGVLNHLADEFIKRKEEETLDDLNLFRPALKRELLHNCIYGVDLNPRAVKLAKMSLWLETAYNGKKLEDLSDQLKTGESLVGFDWKAEFPRAKNGFDALIGNPPYVSSEKLGSLKETLFKSKFECLEYQSDLYVFFIEKFLTLCRAGGRCGLIVPNSFLHYKTMSKLRDYITKKHTTETITKAYDAFPNQTVDTVILLMKNSIPDEKSIIAIKDFAGGELKPVSTIKLCNLRDDNTINLTQRLLSESAIHQLETVTETLGNHFRIKAGIKIRPEFITKEADTKKSRPLLKGRDVSPFTTRWNRKQYVVYSKEAEAKYPNQALRDEKIFSEPKILIRQTADDLIACVDRDGFISMQSTYSIQPKEPAEGVLEYLCCILNSKLIRNFFKTKFKKDKTTFPQIRAYDLEKLPFIIPDKETLKAATKLYAALSKEMTGDSSQLETCKSFADLNGFVEEVYSGTSKVRKKAAA